MVEKSAPRVAELSLPLRKDIRHFTGGETLEEGIKDDQVADVQAHVSEINHDVIHR